MVTALKPDAMRVQPSPMCIVCGCEGATIYHDLDDVLFGVAGRWSISRCVNRECGLLWLDPQPVEEDIGKAYVRYFTHQERAGHVGLPQRLYRHVRSSYLRSKLGYERATTSRTWRWSAPIAQLHPGSGEVFAASVMFLDSPAPGSTLLDVGCGDGDFMVRMRDLGWQTAGVEPDPVAVERATARGLEVHQGALEPAAFGDRRFDAITLAHVIEHVHDPSRLLANCRRLLKPTGRLVILTPNTSSWGHRHFARDWLSLDPPRHIHLFNPLNIRRLLESNKLTPTKIATLAINASAVWPASTAIRRSRSHANRDRPAVGLATTVAGAVRQSQERLMRTFDAAAGEDLLAIATRAE